MSKKSDMFLYALYDGENVIGIFTSFEELYKAHNSEKHASYKKYDWYAEFEVNKIDELGFYWKRIPEVDGN